MLLKIAPAFQVAILRSVQHPLDIVFKLEKGAQEDVAVQFFDVLIKESYRWRSVVLQTHSLNSVGLYEDDSRKDPLSGIFDCGNKR